MTTLGDLCLPGGIQTGPFGSQLHADEYSVEGTPVVMPQDIGDNRFEIGSIARVPDVVVKRLIRHQLKLGDIVYSRRGDVERRSWVSADQEGWLCGTGCLRVRLDPELADSRFVSYCLGNPNCRAWIVAHAVGATMLNLNTSILSAVPVDVPPFPTQRAIAEVLGALDDKIAANQLVEASTDALSLALYRRQAASGGTIARVEDVARVVLGGTPSRARSEFWADGTVPWIASGEANKRRVTIPTEWITEEALQQSAAKMMPRCSTAIAITGATLGQITRLELASAGNQSLVGVWADNPALNDWVYFEMLDSVDELVRGATGAAQQHINRQTVATHEIAVPEGAALRQWGVEARVLLDRAALAARESLELANLRDTLLPHLMSGRITVRDAEKQVGVAL